MLLFDGLVFTHTNRLAMACQWDPQPSVSACEPSIEVAIADVHIGETPESRVSFRKCQADSLVVRFFWNLGKQRQRSVSAKELQKQIRCLPQGSHQSTGIPDPRLTKLACETRSAACRSPENQCSSKVA